MHNLSYCLKGRVCKQDIRKVHSRDPKVVHMHMQLLLRNKCPPAFLNWWLHFFYSDFMCDAFNKIISILNVSASLQKFDLISYES